MRKTKIEKKEIAMGNRLYIYLSILLGVIVIGIMVYEGVGQVQARPVATSSAESLQMIRPGYPYSHQTLSVDGSVTTTELATWAIYRLVCSDDVYYDMGISTVAATTSEAYLPTDTVQYVRTSDTVRYLAAIKKTNACTCYLAEER